MSILSNGSMGDDAPVAEINVTPLVDVMLVLLIVFMVTMPILTHTIPLSLPTSSQEATKHENDIKDPIRLAISREKTYELNGEVISFEVLKQHLEEEFRQNPDLILAISADKTIEYQFVTDILGLAQDIGIHKIGFTTEQPSLLSK